MTKYTTLLTLALAACGGGPPQATEPAAAPTAADAPAGEAPAPVETGPLFDAPQRAGAPCGVWLCGPRAVECACDADERALLGGWDRDGDGDAEVTQRWVGYDDRGAPSGLLRTRGEISQEIALDPDGWPRAVRITERGAEVARVAMYPAISGAPDVAPEAVTDALRVDDREDVWGAEGFSVVVSPALAAIYPEIAIYRGAHQTHFHEYHQLQSLVLQVGDAPPLRVFDHLFDGSGWQELLAALGGAQLTSDAQARALVWSLGALFQPLVDPAHAQQPVVISPTAVDGGFEAQLSKRGVWAVYLELELDADRAVTAIRLASRRTTY